MSRRAPCKKFVAEGRFNNHSAMTLPHLSLAPNSHDSRASTLMTCGHPLSDDLRSALICMGEPLPLNSVAKFSGVPARMLRRLYKKYQKQGHGLRVKAGLETQGAKRMLSMDDTGVSCWFSLYSQYSTPHSL